MFTVILVITFFALVLWLDAPDKDGTAVSQNRPLSTDFKEIWAAFKNHMKREFKS